MPTPSLCRLGLACLLGSASACARATPATVAPNQAPVTNASHDDASAAAAPATTSSSSTRDQPPVRADAPAIVLRGGKVMTAAGTIYERADVLIQGGKIVKVGVDLEVPAQTKVVDVRGKVVTPGIIDAHSHIGVYASPSLAAHSDGNEAVAPVTAYVRAADGYWPQDPQIDSARAGGVTTMHILPGSANLIGGRGVTVRLLPHARSVDDVRFAGAPESLKMACGENPKRGYGDKGGPATRMGNVAGYRRAFQNAVEYKQGLDRYRVELAKWEQGAKKPPNKAANKEADKPATDESAPSSDSQKPTPPSVDFGLETLALVLEGKILVQNHCYRADEMSQMLGLARDFGFKIRSFHHAVEGYKIADRLAKAGTAASVWADWWGFKAEAYDTVLENAALLHVAGVRAVIHSDSAVGIQRLNQEAAKSFYAGQRLGLKISENDALRWITANPAWVLGIDQQTGTLEAGKLADITVWNTSPFSVYSQAQAVWIGGTLVYDRQDPQHQPSTDFAVGLKHQALGGATP